MNYIQELRALVGQRPIVTVGAGVLIVDEQGRLLLQHRKDNNCWGIPGGGVEIGETVEETARREVWEETGLEVGAMTFFDIFSGPEHFYTYPNGDQIYNVSIIFFSDDIRGDLRVNDNEGLAVRFFELDDLPEELNPPNRTIIETLVQRFSQHATARAAKQESFIIEEWDAIHPRRQEFLQCLQAIAPEQAPFVLGEYYRQHQSYLLVALQENEVVGFLRFAVQPIGPEAHCPPLCLQGVPLTEAKIHAFAVREDRRNMGIGTALQKLALQRARVLGCYQVASYSSYGRDANHQVKLALGFGAQPEVHGDNEQGVYFVMPIQPALTQ